MCSDIPLYLICIFLIANKVEQFFSDLLVILDILFCELTVQISYPFLYWVLFLMTFSLFVFINFAYDFFSAILTTIIFSGSVASLFILCNRLVHPEGRLRQSSAYNNLLRSSPMGQ